MRITFVPTVREHLRATAELGKVAPVFDPYALLPRILVLSLLFSLIAALGSLGPPGLFGPLLLLPWGLVLFFAGIGLRARRDEGKPLTYELGDDGIEVRQPRYEWRIGWDRVRKVEETPE